MTDNLERPLSAEVAENLKKSVDEVLEVELHRNRSGKGRSEEKFSSDGHGSHPPQNSEDGPGTTEIIEGNAFAPESIGAVQVILLSRIYDVLLLLLKNQNPADAKMIESMHTAGIPLGPDPSWAGSDE